MTSSSSHHHHPSYYLQMDIECAHLTKNTQIMGVGKMDPFVTVVSETRNQHQAIVQNITRTPTHWDAHKEPIWFHACPLLPLRDDKDKSRILTFTVHNDSSLGVLNQNVIGQAKIRVDELVQRTHNSKAMSLGTAAKIELKLDKGAGILELRVKVRDELSWRNSQQQQLSQQVDPNWFEAPVKRLGVSGGTAPFFALVLTEEGKQATQQTSSAYFIGKDLSHAEDEKEFYEEIKLIQENRLEGQGVGLLTPFIFDYLGILKTTTTESEKPCQLLVMQNLRNNFTTFRMLDLKMGQLTACSGWQGKSRFRAMKQNLLDGMTNSMTEGYRLEGFDGNPKRIESMDPLMDLLAKDTGQNFGNNDKTSSKTLLWGKQVTERDVKKAKRIMFQTLTGAEIFRYFIDVHLEPNALEDFATLLSVEMAEIALHELVSRLVHLAITCHQVQVPQKWIGSSVALGYDAGLSPSRNPEAEGRIRSKVIVNVFDWGRSELLTYKKYQALSDVEKLDRQRFWDNYKSAMDRLAYNAAREYYHHFTNTTGWTDIVLQVMDFDSLTADDYMGKVSITLPYPGDTEALIELQKQNEYKLLGTRAVEQGTIFCSISWLTFPESSRVMGTWRVHIGRACNLPVMDPGTTHSSDPYVAVIAQDAGNQRELRQLTCVKPRNLNPIWNETIDVPVMRANLLKNALEGKAGWFDDSFECKDRNLAKVFQYSANGRDDIQYWTKCLQVSADH